MRKSDRAIAKGASITRRQALKSGIGGVAASTIFSPYVFAQKAPVNLSFWTWEGPQQRPYQEKRIKMFTDANPNVKVDVQVYTFQDLSKKVAVGFATGTAPDGFVSQDWFMPLWLEKNLLAPMDVQRLGYANYKAFTDDYAPAFVDGATKDGKVYATPLWFYGFCNYINTKHFKEVGLDPDKDWPQTWTQLGETAKKLTIKDGNKFTRQGFKWATHSAQWTVIQFNPILIQCGGQWFDANGKCTINSPAGVKAMTIRASLARDYGADDPADSIATPPLPMLDWLKERTSMFLVHGVPPMAIKSQNEKMLAEGYFAVSYPGVEAGKGYSSCYGFNLVINARASKEKQEVLHDLYKFMMGTWSMPGQRPRRSLTPARAAGPKVPRSDNFPILRPSSAPRTQASTCRAPWSTTNWPTRYTEACKRSCCQMPTSRRHLTKSRLKPTAPPSSRRRVDRSSNNLSRLP